MLVKAISEQKPEYITQLNAAFSYFLYCPIRPKMEVIYLLNIYD